MSRILTVEQAADMLHLNPQVVRGYLRKGMLPGRKIGRHWRVLDEDLTDFVRTGSLTQAESSDDVEAAKRSAIEKRHEAIQAALGAFAGSKRTVDDFMREKHEETDEEERRWDERHKARSAEAGEGEAA